MVLQPIQLFFLQKKLPQERSGREAMTNLVVIAVRDFYFYTFSFRKLYVDIFAILSPHPGTGPCARGTQFETQDPGAWENQGQGL